MKKIPALILFSGILLTSPALAEFGPAWQTFGTAIPDRPAVSVSLNYSRGTAAGSQTYASDTAILDAPVVQLNLPLGRRGEAIIGYPVWRSLRGDNINTGNGGDPWFFTKLTLFDGDRIIPDLAFVWGVLEPAANPPIGPDNLAFHARLAASQHLGERQDLRLDMNIGADIHESDSRSRQDDVLVFSSALWFVPGPYWRAGAEFHWADETDGRWFDVTETVDGPYRRRSLAGTLESGQEQTLFFTLRRGLVSQSGSWSGTVGVVWGF